MFGLEKENDSSDRTVLKRKVVLKFTNDQNKIKYIIYVSPDSLCDPFSGKRSKLQHGDFMYKLSNFYFAKLWTLCILQVVTFLVTLKIFSPLLR